MGINKSNQLQRVRRGLVLYLDSKDFTNSPPTSIHRDRSGNGNNATPAGFAYNTASGADGKGGVALFGDNDIFTVPHSSSVNVSGDFTLEFVLSGTNVGVTEVVVNKANQSGSSIGFAVHLRTSAPYVKFIVFDTAAKGTSVCNADIRDGKRHVVQCVKSGNNLKLKIDGVLISNDTLTIGTFTNAEPVRIGESYNSGTPQFLLKATIYMLAMYNRALTDSELNQNYNVSK